MFIPGQLHDPGGAAQCREDEPCRARRATVREMTRAISARARAGEDTARVIEIGDDALVLAARAGDREAEERLVLRHARPLATVAARLLGSRQDAEDVAQEALIDALTGLDRLRDPGAFRSWLTRIAVLRVRQILRRRRIARALGLGAAPADASLEETAAPGCSGEIRAELALLDRALDQLSADLRIPWMLRHVEGMELTEVADACGCSLATVKRRVAAADAHVGRHVRIDDGGER